MLPYFLKILSSLFKNVTFTMRTGLAKGMKRRYGLGFKPKLSLTKEERFLSGLDFSGKTVYDIGGYIGILSMFFSRKTGKEGKVITFEPNPYNYEELNKNLELNNCDNVTTIQLGVGDVNEFLEMVTNPIYPTRGTMKNNRKESLHHHMGSEILIVKVVRLDKIITEKDLPQPDFVKIDTEGFENEVLHGMTETIKKHKPTLYIEMHNKSVKEVIEFLVSNDYSIYHVESDSKILSPDSPVNNLKHLYCV